MIQTSSPTTTGEELVTSVGETTNITFVSADDTTETQTEDGIMILHVISPFRIKFNFNSHKNPSEIKIIYQKDKIRFPCKFFYT